jgi:hypothetical protein
MRGNSWSTLAGGCVGGGEVYGDIERICWHFERASYSIPCGGLFSLGMAGLSRFVVDEGLVGSNHICHQFNPLYFLDIL